MTNLQTSHCLPGGAVEGSSENVGASGRMRKWAGRLFLALAASLPMAAMAAASLDVSFSAGSDEYRAGGDDIPVTIVFSNTGDTAASGAQLTLATLPDEVTVVANSRSCTPTGTDSDCGSAGSGTGGLLYSGAAIAAGGKLTIGASLRFGSTASGQKQVTATGSASGVTDNATASLSFNQVFEADLTVSITRLTLDTQQNDCPNNGTTYTPGCKARYQVVFKNVGPDGVPAGTTLAISRTEQAAGAYTVVSCSASGVTCPSVHPTATMPATVNAVFAKDATLTYDVTVDYPLNQSGTVGVKAQVTAPSSVTEPTPDPNPNTATAQRTRNNSANLAVSVTPRAEDPIAEGCPSPGSTTTYTPGCAAGYTLTVSNTGPDAAAGATLSIWRSELEEGAIEGWTCTANAHAACPDVDDITKPDDVTISTLGAGGTLTYEITVHHPSSDLYPSAGISAAISPPTGTGAPVDINHADNEAADSRSIERRAQVRVTKRALEDEEPISGSIFANAAFDYEIVVYNDGPSDVGNMAGAAGAPQQVDPDGPALVLQDALNSQLKGVTSDCTPNAPGFEPCWTLCPTTLDPAWSGGVVDVSDCPVEKVTGHGMQISQRFSLRAGTGSKLLTRVNVPQVGTPTDIGNTATIALSTCASGASDCAPITLVGTDTSDSVTVNVIPAASATISASSVGGGSAVPGTLHSFKVVVSNAGNAHLPGTLVESDFPLAQGGAVAGFVPGTVYYQCSAFGNACCNTSGTCGLAEPTAPMYANALTVTSNLQSGGRVEYTITGMLDPRGTSDISLHAEARPAAATGAAMVQADVTVSQTPQRDLSLSKRLTRRNDAGATPVLTYEIVAGNNGPSHAPQAVLLDNAVTSGATDFDFGLATWTCETTPAPAPMVAPEASFCSAPSGSGGIENGDLLLDLMPGARATVRFTVPVTQDAGAQVENVAKLSLPGSGEKTAIARTSVRSVYTLAVDKDDGLEFAYPGKEHSYSIAVTNEGPDDAFDVQVRDVMPSMLQNVQWTCAASSPVPGDLHEYLERESSDPLMAGPKASPRQAMVLSPDGRHVYAAGSWVPTGTTTRVSTLAAYFRHATPGLDYGRVEPDPIDTEVNGVDDPSDTGSAVTDMGYPIDMAITPNGAVLYVLSQGASEHHISVFHRVTSLLDPEFGRLSFAGSVATTMLAPRRIVASGTRIYVAGSGSNQNQPAAGTVEVYRPDANNQLPVFVAGATVTAPDNAGPMVLDASATTLFVASTSSSEIRRYAITESGANVGRLTQSAILAAGQAGLTGIGDLVIAGNGRDLYAHSPNGGNARIGRISSTAAALVVNAVYGDKAGSAAVLNGSVRLALSPDGEHLIGVNRDSNAMFTMRRSLSGGLGGGLPGAEDFEQLLWGVGSGHSPEMRALGAPAMLAVTPDNRHVVVAMASQNVDIGSLAVFSRRAPAPQLGFIERDRQGENGVDSLTAPSDVVVRGTHVYVLSQQDSAITRFERRTASAQIEDEDGLHLTPTGDVWRNGQAGITGMERPDRMLISPDGKSAFVTSLDHDSLAVFTRDEATGALSFVRSFSRAEGFPGLLGAFGMAMDASSKHLYVAGSYEAAIAVFSHDSSSPTRLTYVGSVAGGQNGVTGMNGIRDLAVADSNGSSQLIGVSSAANANAVVVFDRDAASGTLAFVHALSLGANQGLAALALSPDTDGNGNAHIYVAAQNTGTLHVLQRIRDGGPATGRVRLVASMVAGSSAPARMAGIRDVVVSSNGKRVYAAAQAGSSLLAFDRYDNASSPLFGQLSVAEVRSQDVDAVDGIRAPYAVAVSSDSRNVYVVGFDSDAVASFSVGTGSMCSAAGSGDIQDTVTIRAGGAVTYTVNSVIRPDATGSLFNAAEVFVSELDPDGNPQERLLAGDDDETDLLTLANLELTKTNNQVSATPGSTVTYEMTVRNAGPGNVVGVGNPALANVSDLFGCTRTGATGYDCSNSPFQPDSISWTCSASGSGTLDFLGVQYDGGTVDGGLAGIASLALIPPGDPVSGVRGSFLVGAAMDDSALVFYRRDAVSGALSFHSRIAHDPAQGRYLDGARSVSTSSDGRFLFVASRRSDSLSVFELGGNASQPLTVALRATARDPLIKGLDQALHVIALPATGNIEHVYVAGANDHAVAAFAFDRVTGTLTHVGSVVNGVNGVQGLADVEYLAASPQGGAHVYAVSGSGASISQFNRNAATGVLSYGARFTEATLGSPLQGVSSLTFDEEGAHLYVTVAGTNRVLVLNRVNDAAAGNFGSLSPGSSLVQGEQGVQGLFNPRRAVLSADGRHLYVVSQAGATLAWFSVHPQTGALGYLGIQVNHSGGVEGMAGATGVVFDAGLDQIYLAGTLDRAIVQFQRQSDSWCPPNGTGLLDAVPVNIAAQGQVTFRLIATVSSQLPGDLVNVGRVDWQSASDGCNDVPGIVLGSCWLEEEDRDVPSRLADLSITKDDGLAEFDGLAGAAALAADLRNIYVAAPGDNAIGTFRREAGANSGVGLRYVGVSRSGTTGVSGLAGVADLVASADGHHVYAASPVDNAVTAFVRASGDGALTQIDQDQNGLLGVTGLSGARALALSSDGEHVYVAGGFSNAVAIFRRQTNTTSADFGKLSFVTAVQAGIGNVSGIESPLALALSPDDKYLYVLGGAGDVLVAFSRNDNGGSADFGKLTQIDRYQNASAGVLGMDTVRSLVVGDDDVYVLGAEAGSLVHFARDAGNGKLGFVPHSPTQAVFQSPELIGAARMRRGDDGQLYVAAAARNAVVVIGFDPLDGTPSVVHAVHDGDTPPNPAVGLVDGLAGVADVAFVNDGQNWVYAGGATDGALLAFALATGEPDYLGTLFDGMGGVAPGDSVTYTIIATNHGPSDVLVAHVVDNFPPEFERVSWICSGYAGGECTNEGEGNLDLEVKLAAGGRVQIQATGVVGPKAVGRLVNTATVTATNVLDPNLGNNSATDDDTVLAPEMDLSIAVDDNGCDLSDPACEEVTEATPGGSIAYRVVASNAGPTYASGALVGDTLPAALYDVGWTCTPTPYAGLLQAVGAPTTGDFDLGYRALAADVLGNHVYAVGTRSDTNGVRDTVVAFNRDPLNGVLTRLSSWSDGQVVALPDGSGNAPPVRGIAGAVDVVLTADGRFLYVAGQDADSIAVFARDAATGLLSWRSQVTDGELGVDGIGGIASLVLSPDGRHLYGGGAADQAIAVFNINATTGALTQASVVRQGQAGVNGLNGVSDLAFDEAGTVLFATATTNRSVTAFRRAVADGALSHVVTIEDGQVGMTASLLSPSALSVHEDRVFVADAQGDAVNLLRFVDGTTPAFEVDEVIALDSDGVPASQQPVALAFRPDQMRLYVASRASGQIHLYSLLDVASQHLASYSTADSTALDQVAALVLAPSGRQLYVASAAAGQVATFAREAGSRCPLMGEGGLGTQRVDIAPGGSVHFDVVGRIFANATGTLDYAVSVDPRVPAYETQPFDNRASDSDTLVPAPDLETRKLRLTDDEEVIAGLPVAWRIEVDNHGVSDALGALLGDALPLFPVDGAGLVVDSGEWSCSANLPLRNAEQIAASLEERVADLSALAHTPDGQRWFGVSRSRSALVELRLGPGGDIDSISQLVDGDSTGNAVIAGLAGASHLAVAPDGRHLYVTAATSNSVLAFAIEPDGLHFLQRLTSGSDGVAGLQGAAWVVVSPDGRFIYTAAVPSNVNASAIALFQRDAESGELAFVERIQDGLGTFQADSNVIRGVKRLHLSADGRHLYAIATVSQALSRFDVSAGSGSLSYVGVQRGIGASAMPMLAGVRDMVATPGDGQLYVLADAGVSLFTRALNGSLTPGATWAVPATTAGRALGIDTWGSRVYVADAEGAVHLYARQWIDGALEHRFSLPPSADGEPGALLHLPPLGEVVLTQAGTAGGLTRIVEQPISRCLTGMGGNDELPVPLDLGVGGTSQVVYEATVHPSARGTLRNVAKAVPGSGVDPNPANDEGIDETPIHVVSDLSIEKAGPTGAVAGEFIDYVITVHNAGPSDALGIRVVDPLDPLRFVDASWTCEIEGTGGSSCDSASGAGATLDAKADLHVGDVLKVNLHVRVHPRWIGPLQNAAEVVPEPDSIDPTPGDHTATPVTTEVVRRPNLSISKTNGVTSSVAGLPVAYTIVVANAGPSDAPSARVEDVLPPELLDAIWTCTPTLGTGQCQGIGYGPIDSVVDIPVGESLIYQVDALLASSATGTLVNTASVQVLGDAEDPDLSDNQATDTDAIVVRADLAVTAHAPDAFDPAGPDPMGYRVDIQNIGPSDARQTVAALAFNHPILAVGADCEQLTPTRVDCHFGSIAAGTTATIGLGVAELPAVPAVLTSSVQVASSAGDPVPGNNTANTSTQMRTGVDLAVSIDDGRIGLAPGDTSDYVIRVRNIGSLDALDARIESPLAAELIDAAWQCVASGGAVCTSASGSGGIDEYIDVPAGGQLTYTLTATVDPTINVMLHETVVQTVTVTSDPSQDEVSIQNNVASDINEVFKVIFKDGFEDTPVPRPQASAGERVTGWPGVLMFRPTPDAAAPLSPSPASVRWAFFDGRAAA